MPWPARCPPLCRLPTRQRSEAVVILLVGAFVLGKVKEGLVRTEDRQDDQRTAQHSWMVRV